MKMKRTVSVILSALLVLTALASCQILPNNNGVGGKDEVLGENQIYSASSELYMIIGADADQDKGLEIINAIDSARSVGIKVAPPTSEAHEHEIILGTTDREISKTAIARMQRLNKEQGDLSYLIYSDGKSVAIVFDEDTDGVSESLAVKYFIENYVKGSLTLTPGVAYSRSYDIGEEYYAVLDAEAREKTWQRIEEQIGGELGAQMVESMKQLYAAYTNDVVVWLANLFDSDICVCYGLYGLDKCDGNGTKYCGTAGFYYSNSARDSMGYLPDAESTSQALGFIESSGLARLHGSSYVKALPEEIITKIGDFIISLQEPNGFFYHPQWGIEGTDAKLSRRARDLNWCDSMLKKMGRTANWDNPLGTKGKNPIGTVLTSYYGGSVADAVSKVVAAEDVYASHLQDDVAFKAYLATLDIHNSSYPVGNTLTAQFAQIKQRDRELAAQGADYKLADILIDYLNDNQNPETGHWDWKKPGDKGYSDYYGVNGLLKISGIYQSAGVMMPHSMEAVQSAIDAITADEPIGAGVDLYNTWFSINNILENIKNNGTDEDKADGERVLQMLREQAPAAIIVSRDKIASFKKPDGSFSYTPKYSSSTSQGCPAALPNSEEGDVNGNIIAMTGLIGNICSALDMSRPLLFGAYERHIFVEIIENQNSIIKNEEVTSFEPITFDDDDVGMRSDSISSTHYGTGTAYVAEHPDGKGNVTEIISHVGKGDYVYIPCLSTSTTSNTLVFEGDFCISEYAGLNGDPYGVQINMGTAYMFSFRIYGDEVHIIETSSGSTTTAMEESFGVAGKLGEWFKIKVEYYYGDHNTVRIKFYLDKDLTDDKDAELIAVTDNYFDGSGIKVNQGIGTPKNSYPRTEIYAMSNAEMKMYIDNVCSYKTKNTYVKVTDPNNQPMINVDAPDKAEKVYGFDDGIIHADITSGGTENPTVTDGGTLLLREGSEISVPVNVRTSGSNVGSVAMDFYCDTAKIGATVLSVTIMDGTTSMTAADLVVRSDVDGDYIAIVPRGISVGADIAGVKIPLYETVRLEFDYYHAEDKLLFYVNGRMVGVGEELYSAAKRSTMDSCTIRGTAEIDDLVVEKKIGDFEKAVEPEKASDIYDFESDKAGLFLSGGSQIVSYGDGSVLNMNAVGSKASFSIPVNNRSTFCTAYTVEFNVKFVEKDRNGQTHLISLVTDDGKTVMAFALKVESGNIGIYEVGEGGTLNSPLTVVKNPDFKFKVEIFPRNHLAYIYVDNQLAAISSAFYNPDNRLLAAASLSVESSNVGSIAEFDNVRAEALYGIFEKLSIKDAENSERDPMDTITFETSNTGNIPSTVSKKIYGGSSSVRIENVFNPLMNGGSGEWSNALVAETFPGANDSVTFNSVSDLKEYSCVTFEMDLKMDAVSKDHYYQMMFGANDNGKKAYMLQLSPAGAGLFKILDASNSSNFDAQVCTLKTGMKIGDWMHLKLEIFKGDRDSVRMRLYVNGEQVSVSNNFFGFEIDGENPYDLIQSVTFYAFSATEASLYIDNVSIVGSNATCTDDIDVSNIKEPGKN